MYNVFLSLNISLRMRSPVVSPVHDVLLVRLITSCCCSHVSCSRPWKEIIISPSCKLISSSLLESLKKSLTFVKLSLNSPRPRHWWWIIRYNFFHFFWGRWYWVWNIFKQGNKWTIGPATAASASVNYLFYLKLTFSQPSESRRESPWLPRPPSPRWWRGWCRGRTAGPRGCGVKY